LTWPDSDTQPSKFAGVYVRNFKSLTTIRVQVNRVRRFKVTVRVCVEICVRVRVRLKFEIRIAVMVSGRRRLKLRIES